MMTEKNIHRFLTFFIAAVWIINGLFAKVLGFVPRHEEIVSRILIDEYSGPLTKAIGIAEMLMAVWVLSGIKTRLNAVTQISVVATMNILEFILVSDLLLWGRANSLFALTFIGIIFYKEFILNKKLALQT